MKTCAFVVAAALCGAASAHAADLKAAPGSPAYYPPSSGWNGFYVGAQLGGGFSSVSWTNPLSGSSDSPHPNGVLGGLQIGVNHQFDSWVLGVGADIDGAGLKGSATDALGNVHTTTQSWLSTVTGRVGYAVDRVMFYGKGGIAFTNERDSVAGPSGTANTNVFTRVGWTAGGGVEYALSANWSALVEYDYMGFGSTNLTIAGAPIPGVPATLNLNVQKVVGGVNYRF